MRPPWETPGGFWELEHTPTMGPALPLRPTTIEQWVSISASVCVTPGDIYQNLEALCLSQLGWGATGIWYFKAGDAGKHPAVHRIAPKQSVIWPKMSVTPKSCPVEMKTCSQKSLHRTVYRNSSLKYCKTQEKPKCASATREQINRDAP